MERTLKLNVSSNHHVTMGKSLSHMSLYFFSCQHRGRATSTKQGNLCKSQAPYKGIQQVFLVSAKQWRRGWCVSWFMLQLPAESIRHYDTARSRSTAAMLQFSPVKTDVYHTPLSPFLRFRFKAHGSTCDWQNINHIKNFSCRRASSLCSTGTHTPKEARVAGKWASPVSHAILCGKPVSHDIHPAVSCLRVYYIIWRKGLYRWPQGREIVLDYLGGRNVMTWAQWKRK